MPWRLLELAVEQALPESPLEEAPLASPVDSGIRFPINTTLMKQRIRHIFPHNAGLPTASGDQIPRGWITPQGRFHKTKEHWVAITSHFRRPETRAIGKEEAPEEADAAEKNAHLAYSLGWISVGHAGKLNAVGHQRTFETLSHPAVLTLRRLLADQPYLSITVETQLGLFVPSRGVHEDFELRECDLDILIKRGKLRQTRVPG